MPLQRPRRKRPHEDYERQQANLATVNREVADYFDAVSIFPQMARIDNTHPGYQYCPGAKSTDKRRKTWREFSWAIVAMGIVVVLLGFLVGTGAWVFSL